MHRALLPAVSLAATAILPQALHAQYRARTLAYQLTHAANYDPAFSPDGRRVVYISVYQGREQLFVMNPDGTHVRQLTHDSADHEDPAWSPDGHTIAYVTIADSTERIALIDSAGGPPRLVTPLTIRAIHPAWKPDGSAIAFCADDDLHPPRKNPADIYTVDLATGRVQSLISGGVNTYPVWSPDGKEIAFRRMIGEMNSEVFLAHADGSDVRNLTNHPAFDGWPAWSPDGKWIAFASNRRSSYQIYIMRPDGTDVQLVANTEGRATAPKWAPDGAALYFPICRNVDFSVDCEIFVARLDGRIR